MAVFQVYFYIGTTISCRGNSAALLFFYCKRGLGPAAIAILLGVVFAQMMYHHSVNQQMSLKLGCLSAILESLVGFDGKNIEALPYVYCLIGKNTPKLLKITLPIT